LDLKAASTQFFKEAAEKGGTCPCCHRWGKFNQCKVTPPTLGRVMLWFRKQHLKEPNAWVSIHSFPIWLIGRSMHARLKHWGLLEHKPKDPENTKDKTSGLWRITENGLLFAEGKLRVQEAVWVYKDKVLKKSGPKVSIRECVKGFNYAEMMSGTFNDAQ